MYFYSGLQGWCADCTDLLCVTYAKYTPSSCTVSCFNDAHAHARKSREQSKTYIHRSYLAKLTGLLQGHKNSHFTSLSDGYSTKDLLWKWIFGADKGKCTGNFPVFLKSVGVHNWQPHRFRGFKVFFELELRFRIHIDFLLSCTAHFCAQLACQYPACRVHTLSPEM